MSKLSLFRHKLSNQLIFFLNSSDGMTPIDNLPDEDNEMLTFVSDAPENVIRGSNMKVKYAASKGDHLLYSREIDRGRAYLIVYAVDLSGYFVMLQRMIVLASAVFYAILVLCQTRLHQRILIQPIERICKMMISIDTNNFSRRLEVDNSSEEIRVLSEEFNRMMDQLQYLYNEVYKRQLLLKEAELQNL